MQAFGQSVKLVSDFAFWAGEARERFAVLSMSAWTMRKAAERTIHGLWNAIGRILELYSPHECANYFAACGYDAD